MQGNAQLENREGRGKGMQGRCTIMKWTRKVDRLRYTQRGHKHYCRNFLPGHVWSMQQRHGSKQETSEQAETVAGAAVRVTWDGGEVHMKRSYIAKGRRQQQTQKLSSVGGVLHEWQVRYTCTDSLELGMVAFQPTIPDSQVRYPAISLVRVLLIFRGALLW